MASFPGQMLMAPPPYNDQILTITERTTPDPYVVWENGVYYMTWTAGDRVEIWSADSLFDFEKRAKKDVIWRPPPNTPYSGDLWAPELHSLHGRWYVYFAADDPSIGNRSHRMYVLSGPPSHEPPLNPSSWTYHGPLSGMPPTQWAIDGTILTLHNTLYFVYSGWPLSNGTTHDESKQEIYITEMSSPTQCIGHPTRISTPDHQWEYSGNSGINEGPQVLTSPDGRWLGLAFSCAGSWTHQYKMSVLQYVGGNPVSEAAWQKWNSPLLQARKDDKPPYGPGHGNFVAVNGPAGQEVWGVFHATDGKTGWEGRRARVMRVGWGAGGPFMGRGECGDCSADVGAFLYGGQMGGGGGFGSGGDRSGGGGGKDLKGELKGLFREGKGFLSKFMK
ncbi:glycoside hydrolase family 43 protein [Amniculicola lignicola CBS 123094]|uniref:Glycoside hydrolase family 43 protein n=1 Tax=Amniculicola lignicola CBS 123094 TaxID=1392246 RepID=A0A6A5WWT8_9PLEO|nr:glycoside hydrolase family 43 protein [Amniculicola lignicola CBS 123094]